RAAQRPRSRAGPRARTRRRRRGAADHLVESPLARAGDRRHRGGGAQAGCAGGPALGGVRQGRVGGPPARRHRARRARALGLLAPGRSRVPLPGRRIARRAPGARERRPGRHRRRRAARARGLPRGHDPLRLRPDRSARPRRVPRARGPERADHAAAMSPRAPALRKRRGYLVPVSSGALARAVFVLLVLATVAAFFVTQRLKSGQPVVKRLALQRYFSPNGDGRKDRARISFFLPKGDLVTVDVVDGEGDRVRRLVDGRSLRRGRHVYNWDGRADDGTVPPDGTDYVRVTLRRQGRAATGVRGIELVTEPPHPKLIAVTPSWLPAGSAGPVTIHYTGPSAVPPVYGIWRTGGGPAKRVATLVGDRQTHSIRWDAQVGGRPAPPGGYAVSVTVQNRA